MGHAILASVDSDMCHATSVMVAMTTESQMYQMMLKYVVTRIVKQLVLKTLKVKVLYKSLGDRLLNKMIHLSILRRCVLLVKITL